MNLKQIKDGNYAGKTYTVSYEDIVDAAAAIISSVGFEYRDLQDFKAYVNLVLPANVVDAAAKEAYRNAKQNVTDSAKVSDDDDAFDEYFDYSEESMEENDKVNDKCGGKKRKVGDAKISNIEISQAGIDPDMFPKGIVRDEDFEDNTYFTNYIVLQGDDMIYDADFYNDPEGAIEHAKDFDGDVSVVCQVRDDEGVVDEWTVWHNGTYIYGI